MKRSRFTGEQFIGMLKEQEAGMSAIDICGKHEVSTATFNLRTPRNSGGGSELRPVEEPALPSSIGGPPQGFRPDGSGLCSFDPDLEQRTA